MAHALEAFRGEQVQVETHDGRLVSGILDSVDRGLNLVLGNARCTFIEGPKRGEAFDVAVLLLSAANVYQVHLPEFDKQIKQFSDRKRIASMRHKRGYIKRKN